MTKINPSGPNLGSSMLVISATDEWRAAHPGATLGFLELSGADNTRPSPALDEPKREVEARLREHYQGFTRQAFLSLPVMADYERYYRRFDKTYHVLLQLESLVLKGKNLPDVNPLVDANFMAELETLVLTAGHDVERLHQPVLMDVSRAGDQIIQMDGTSRAIRAGDMIMRDAQGISCSILYGQDNRSPISAQTSSVLYVAYAPPGVPLASIETQLNTITDNIRLFSPACVVEQHQLFSA
jgi:DNA/RNA-binding domain of Phe-tRNA-synthetase-like protein